MMRFSPLFILMILLLQGCWSVEDTFENEYRRYESCNQFFQLLDNAVMTDSTIKYVDSQSEFINRVPDVLGSKRMKSIEADTSNEYLTMLLEHEKCHFLGIRFLDDHRVYELNRYLMKNDALTGVHAGSQEFKQRIFYVIGKDNSIAYKDVPKLKGERLIERKELDAYASLMVTHYP